jgi:hypothetical protein
MTTENRGCLKTPAGEQINSGRPERKPHTAGTADARDEKVDTPTMQSDSSRSLCLASIDTETPRCPPRAAVRRAASP